MILALLLAAAAPAQPAMEAALRRHIAVLASDEYEGRKPGTAGETKAVSYIAAQLQTAGLRPGAKDGGWYQRVDLVHREPVASKVTLSNHGEALAVSPNRIVMIGREAAVRLTNAPVVFAGFARPADLAHIDPSGALVIFRTDLPKGEDGASIGERRQALLDRGAAAVVSVSDEAPWERVAAGYARGFDMLATDPGAPLRGAADVAAAKALLAAAGAPPTLYDAATPMMLGATAQVDATTAVRVYPSYNVVGLLSGRDAAGEAIAFTAHWDHLGLCRPAGAPDRICNGAVDNASGIAMLIEVARGLAQRPPQRDALFVATTAEELGLLGAEAFAADPPRPLPKIVAALNVDTTAITPAGQPVAIIGRGITPSLDAAVDAVTRRLGRRVDGDTEANELVQRQDGWALGKRGLPSVMIGGSFSDMKVLEGYLGGNYHQPTDDLAHLPPLGGASEDVALHVAAGEALGDRRTYPTPRR